MELLPGMYKWLFTVNTTNFPLNTAKVLIDAVGYVCYESVKCDDCALQTSRNELTLSPSVPLHEHRIKMKYNLEFLNGQFY